MGLKLEQIKENQDAFIQLPWAVPQQSVQTLVIQQPTKTHMELNASTDKTAISSFALSVVIALILGGLATWLAYWYGRKSFDLTRHSFDAVVKQIESSVLITLKSNQYLIDAQNITKIKELRILQKTAEIDKFRDIVAEFFTQVRAVEYFYHQSHGYSGNSIFIARDKSRFKESLRIHKEFLNQISSKVWTYLNPLDDTHQRVHLEILELNKTAMGMLENETNSQIHHEISQIYIQQSTRLNTNLRLILLSEIENNKGE